MTELIRWGPSILTHAELLMLLYYAERTIPYNKLADASSLRQITDGIFSRSKGEWIRGTSGLCATAAKKASKALAAKGLLIRRPAVPGTERYRPDRGNEATEYEIHWAALREKFEERRHVPPKHVVTKPLGRAATKSLGRDVTHNRGDELTEGKTAIRPTQTGPADRPRSPAGTQPSRAVPESPPNKEPEPENIKWPDFTGKNQ